MHTVSSMAAAAGTGIYRVQWIIKTHNIPYMRFVGNTRVYSAAAFRRVKAELAKIDGAKASRKRVSMA